MLKLSATNEKVNHPPHYRSDTGYEAIDVIEAWELGFNLGNVVKYISRAGHKDSSLQDLKKALWYLQREVTNRESSKEVHGPARSGRPRC
jgi:hypothetical protein